MKRVLLIALLLTLNFSCCFAEDENPDAKTSATSQSLFDKAQKCFQEKDYKQAKQILTRLVAEHPMEGFIPKARLLLANLQEDFTISITQFETLASEYAGQPEGAEAQKDLGSRYYLADKYSEAAESYRDFLRDYPKSPFVCEAHYWYASSLVQLDEDKAAVDEFKQVLDKGKDSPWAPKALLGMGNAYFKMKKYQDAQKQYLRILDQYPLYDEMNLVYLKLGETYEVEKKYKEAHAAYRTLLAQYPKSLEVGEAQAEMLALEKGYPQLFPSSSPSAQPIATPTASVTEVSIPTPQPTALVTEAEATPTEEVPSERQDQPAPESAKPFHVQVGVYTRWANVLKTEKEIKKAGFTPFIVKVKKEDIPYTYYKIRVGNFANRLQAEKAAKVLARRTKEKTIVIEN